MRWHNYMAAMSLRHHTDWTELHRRFGPALRDVILVVRYEDGKPRSYHTCEAKYIRRTLASEMSLAEFARTVYGHGRLRRIDAYRYAVLAPEGRR